MSPAPPKEARRPLAKASQPNGKGSSDHGSAPSVGYGRPPVHTRFKPGQSGNPRGRRKGQRNVSTVLAETLNQRIRIREADRTRSLTKLDVWITIKNEAKAHAALITMLQSTGMMGEIPEIANAQPIRVNDKALVKDFLRRQTPQVRAVVIVFILTR